MATITVTQSGAQPVPNSVQRYALAGWATFADSGDVGEALAFPEYPDRSVQVSGGFGSGGQIELEGSNDGTNYYTLRDPQGDALLFVAADLRAILEPARYIRPRQSAGSGATITVTVFARGR
jgi:hypothetical protein